MSKNPDGEIKFKSNFFLFFFFLYIYRLFVSFFNIYILIIL